MSKKVWEWLRRLRLASLLNHEQRVEVDKEIERRTGVDCDRALEEKRISDLEFRELVEFILKKKKKKVMEIVV